MTDSTKYTSKITSARILVIGGTSGIGYSAAECLLEHGVSTLILSSSNQAKINAKVAQLQKAYPSKASRVSGFACNLADQGALEGNIKSLLDAATENGTKKLDHVIHTAGDPLKILPISEIDMPTLVQAGMVRFFSAIMLCKHAPAYLNPGPASSITLTTGAVSERPRKNWSAPVGYATGLHGVTRGMALDLAPVRVNLISPGAVETELWDNMGMSAEQKAGMLKQMGGTMPTGRAGRPEDLAEAYLYLVKDENITGSVLSSNGGGLLV